MPRLSRHAELGVSALCIAGVLGVLSRLGASPRLLVYAGFFLAVVAVARSTLWRGRRPALAALLTGGAIGLLIFGCLLLHALLWFLIELAYSPYYATQSFAEMTMLAPVCAIVGYVAHVLFSACSSTLRVLCASHAAWCGEERLRFRPPPKVWRRIVVYAFAAVIVIVVYRPLETATCSRVARHFYVRIRKDAPLPPVEAWLWRLQCDHEPHPYVENQTCYIMIIEACRDHLVASGALVHRRFVFKHVMSSTSEASAVWGAACAEFPKNIYTSAKWDPGNPLVVDVYAPPEEIPKWECFVREHDVPNSREGTRDRNGDLAALWRPWPA